MNKNIAIKEDSSLVLSKTKNLIDITNKILNTKNSLIKDNWIERLWRWADKNDIPDLYYDEDLGIPVTTMHMAFLVVKKAYLH